MEFSACEVYTGRFNGTRSILLTKESESAEIKCARNARSNFDAVWRPLNKVERRKGDAGSGAPMKRKWRRRRSPVAFRAHERWGIGVREGCKRRVMYASRSVQ
jgi:hypothetical protein